MIDECLLQVDADSYVLLDAERRLPIQRVSARGSRYDFTRLRGIGPQVLGVSATDLRRDPDAWAYVRLVRSDTSVVELWVDPAYRVIQIWTGDAFRSGPRRLLGAEPMSCEPNAFRTGRDVTHLYPGQSTVARWGVRAAPAIR